LELAGRQSIRLDYLENLSKTYLPFSQAIGVP
jgi:hypothetical protein